MHAEEKNPHSLTSVTRPQCTELVFVLSPGVGNVAYLSHR